MEWANSFQQFWFSLWLNQFLTFIQRVFAIAFFSFKMGYFLSSTKPTPIQITEFEQQVGLINLSYSS